MNGENEFDIEEPQVEGQMAEPAVAEPKDDPNKDLAVAVRELRDHMATKKDEGGNARQPTANEIEDFWKIFNPTKGNDKFYHEFFGLAPDAPEEDLASRKKIFEYMQKGLVHQAVRAAQIYMDQKEEGLKKEFGPLREHIESSRAENATKRFYGDFPALEDKRYKRILSAVNGDIQAEVKAGSRTFKSEKEYFQAVANAAAEEIRGLDPRFDLGSPRKTTVTTPRLPRTTAGGTGGAGNGGGGGVPTENPMDALLADD